MRPLAMALAAIATIAAWPQDPLPPPVDHSQHPLVEVPDDRPAPAMRISLTADAMDGFNVFLETENFRFAPEAVGSEPVPNEGHAHLYVNGVKVARMYSPWHHLSAALLEDGINRIEVEFSTNDHSVWAIAGGPIGADVLIDRSRRDSDPILREEVRYTLDWEMAGARRHRAGGWTATTNLGYQVRVRAGQLITRNLELVPCHQLQPRPQASLLRWLAPAQVAAGHSSMTPNESKITDSYAEDLADPRPWLIETKVVTDPEYCRAHYLIARGRGLPPGAASMWVSGTWATAGSAKGAPFRLETAGAYGQFKDLRTAAGPQPRRSIVGGINVNVRRSLGTLFDDVDFESGSGEAQAMQVLRGLVGGTEVLVTQ